jgi:hypothetical protein
MGHGHIRDAGALAKPNLIHEHSLALDALAKLVRAGSAAFALGKMQAGCRMIEAPRVNATDAGRRMVAH